MQDGYVPARRPPSLDAPAAPGGVSVPAGQQMPAGNGTSVRGDPLSGFGALTRDWFTSAFSEPTQAQAQAWAAIAAGDNTLVIAPTGSGKTLAAFLWALDRLASDPVPADPKLRCRVLYVSPLKALAVDIERNLRAPLTGIRQVAQRRGLPEPDIAVAVRTGDTAADERRRLASKPPDILITTPESLFLILTSRARDALRGVDTVIVDEVHALAGNKRGAHLALSLERLDALRAGAGGDDTGSSGGPASRASVSPAARAAQRIGLSATVRPPEEVAAFLGGSRPVTIAAPPSSKQIEVKIVVPVEDMSDLDAPAAVTPGAGPDSVPSVLVGPQGPDGSTPVAPVPAAQRSIWPHVEERVLDLIEQHRSTIVFANSRRLAERLTARLNELESERQGVALEPQTKPPAELMAESGSGRPASEVVVARAHHGSVSREQRSIVEEELKAGRLPSVVATSSLELGIDMGAVDLVVQVEAPPSVASGLQRVGRAGHQV